MLPNSPSPVLALQILTAAAKIAVPGIAGRVEGVKELAAALEGGRPTTRRQRKSLQYQLELAVESISERLAPWEAVEVPALDSGDKSRATAIVVDALVLVASDQSLDRLLHSPPEVLEAPLLRECERLGRKNLISEAGIGYAERLASRAGRLLAAVVREMPQVMEQVALETHDVTNKIYRLLDAAVDNAVLPSHRRGSALELARHDA